MSTSRNHTGNQLTKIALTHQIQFRISHISGLAGPLIFYAKMGPVCRDRVLLFARERSERELALNPLLRVRNNKLIYLPFGGNFNANFAAFLYLVTYVRFLNISLRFE